MNIPTRSLVLLLCGAMWPLAASAGSPAPIVVLLDADFEQAALNQPIPTRGPAFGEPIEVSPGMAAIVRDGVMATQSLEIAEASTTGARHVVFELLDHAEIARGRLSVHLEIFPMQLGNYAIGVREQGGAARNFFDCVLTENGLLSVIAPAGATVNYKAGHALQFDLLFDLDARTLDLGIDGNLLLDDAALTVADRGVGRIFVGHDFDVDVAGIFHLDNLEVIYFDDPIFADGFDGTP